MECQSNDSKKLFKVFDASKRKRTKKERNGADDNSVVTDDSAGGYQGIRRSVSAKASLQDISASQGMDMSTENNTGNRLNSPSATPRSSRRHRRLGKENSLALKAGVTSSPRSITPPQEEDIGIEPLAADRNDSFIYAFLEEAIKKDKKKQRNARRKEEQQASPEREGGTRDHHRHHHRRHRDDAPREQERDKFPKEDSRGLDQNALYETFAKLYKQMNPKAQHKCSKVKRVNSNKSLQCEDLSRVDSYRMHTQNEHSQVNMSPSRARSNEDVNIRRRSREKVDQIDHVEKCNIGYNSGYEYVPRINNLRRTAEDERCRDYSFSKDFRSENDNSHYRSRVDSRDYVEYEDRRSRDKYYDDRKRNIDNTSRSYDLYKKGGYVEDEHGSRRTLRNERTKSKQYDERDRRFDDRDYRDKIYDEKALDCHDRRYCSKDPHRLRKNKECFERISTTSRENFYRDKERDKYSERERDSGLSVADETSTISGRSTYLKAVKQEIAEQREAMDKMMKLWKDLMKCFKNLSQAQALDSNNETASHARESATEQLRLWRECMRRYETVARDVGDTDARLMEEITKQRSEMAEMSSMWQECLQRYRDMSNDFNSLKKQVTTTHLATTESPSRIPPPPHPPLICAEGEATIPTAPYRLPPNYPQIPPGAMPAGYGGGGGGSPLRPRASVPPAWWWCPDAPRSPHSPRRRSSPDSRGSRDRDRRHRHKDRDRDRDDTRYKAKSSKPTVAKSEHRHRKR